MSLLQVQCAVTQADHAFSASTGMALHEMCQCTLLAHVIVCHHMQQSDIGQGGAVQIQH